MTFSEYFNSIENTEQEQKALELFAKSFSEVKDELAKAVNYPFIGKCLRALLALSKATSVTEFKQTDHYNNIKNWDINVDQLEKGNIQINPGPTHKEAIIEVAAMVGALLLGFWLGRKFGKSKKKRK